LIAFTNNLDLRQYEGGPGYFQGLVGGLQNNTQLADYANNWAYDTSPNGVSLACSIAFQAWSNQFFGYPAKFEEAGQLSPFAGLRYYPGDEGNGTWAAQVAQNNLGPFVDPTPAATGVFAYKGSNSFSGSGNTQTFTMDVGTATVNRVLIAGVATAGGTISGITVNGVSLPNLDASGSTGGAQAIFSGVGVAFGSGVQTIIVTYASASFQNRGVFVATYVGPISTSVVAQTNNGVGNSALINELKNGLVVSMGGFAFGQTPSYFGSTIAPTFAFTSQACFGYWSPSFSTPIFTSNLGGIGGGQCLATYR